MQNSGWWVFQILRNVPQNTGIHFGASITLGAFIVTSLLTTEPPPTDTLKRGRVPLLQPFFCVISVVTAVTTSPSPDRSLSPYPDKPHSEEKCRTVELETVISASPLCSFLSRCYQYHVPSVM